MLGRHRILSVLMVSALGTLAGCGSDGAEVPVEETDTGTTPEDTGSTTIDTSTPEDTGSSEDTSTPEDTGTPSETGDDTSTPTDTGTPSDGDVDTAVPTDSGPTDTGSMMDTSTSGCTSAAITTMGYTDTKVRQGAGIIQITATGTGLSGVTAATLLGAACTVVGTPTATSAVFSCNVAHGAALGAADLAITGGPTCTAAVTVEKITVAAATMGASDTTGLGTSTKPFRSVTKGLSVADGGDTVFIAANGMNAYTTTGTGESWLSTTTDNAYAAAANVKAGVTIEGDTTGVTRLSVGGTTTGSTTSSAFRFAGTATVKNITLENFKWGVIASTGTITLTDVVIPNSNRDAVIANTGAGESLAVNLSAATAGSGTTASKCLLSGNTVGVRSSGPGTNVTLTNCDVTTSRSTGAYVTNSGKITTTATRFTGNGTATGTSVPGGSRPGIYIEGTSLLTMTGGEVSTSYDYGIWVAGGAAISLTNVAVKTNGKALGSTANSGITLNPGTTNAKVTLVGGEVSDNGYAGLNLSGAAEADITGTSFAANQIGILIQNTRKFVAKGISITASTSYGVQITGGSNANEEIDFLPNGTTPTSISRTVASPVVTSALVRDERGDTTATTGTLTTVTFAAGTLFQGAVGAVATYTGATTYSNGGQMILSITGTNRKIQLL